LNFSFICVFYFSVKFIRFQRLPILIYIKNDKYIDISCPQGVKIDISSFTYFDQISSFLLVFSLHGAHQTFSLYDGRGSYEVEGVYDGNLKVLFDWINSFG